MRQHRIKSANNNGSICVLVVQEAFPFILFSPHKTCYPLCKLHFQGYANNELFKKPSDLELVKKDILVNQWLNNAYRNTCNCFIRPRYHIKHTAQYD